GRTQLRKTASTASQPQEIASSSVTPVEPIEPITVSTQLSIEKKEIEGSQEVQAAQMSPSTDGELSVVSIVDQPTGAIPPTPVKAHPELSTGFPTVDEALPTAAE